MRSRIRYVFFYLSIIPFASAGCSRHAAINDYADDAFFICREQAVIGAYSFMLDKCSETNEGKQRPCSYNVYYHNKLLGKVAHIYQLYYDADTETIVMQTINDALKKSFSLQAVQNGRRSAAKPSNSLFDCLAYDNGIFYATNDDHLYQIYEDQKEEIFSRLDKYDNIISNILIRNGRINCLLYQGQKQTVSLLNIHPGTGGKPVKINETELLHIDMGPWQYFNPLDGPYLAISPDNHQLAFTIKNELFIGDLNEQTSMHRKKYPEAIRIMSIDNSSQATLQRLDIRPAEESMPDWDESFYGYYPEQEIFTWNPHRP